MSLEAMKLISDAETEAARRREEALARAGRELAAAKEEGQLRLEQAKKTAADEAAAFLAQKTVEQQKAAAAARAKTRQACMSLRAEAEGRMEQAARAIAERIVES